MATRMARPVAVTLALVTLLTAGGSRAESTMQPLTLLRGWNAVFLEVEPENPAPAAVFAGVSGLRSVWTWNWRTSPMEAVDNLGNPLDPPASMFVYFPATVLPDVPADVLAGINNLMAIAGGMPYLVHVGDTGPASQVWAVSGQPVPPRARWKANSFNLVGFHLAPGAEPTFESFFAGSPAHAGQEIYRLDNASGSWQRVASPASTFMARGEAFWVYCKGSSTFAGPLAVQLGVSTGLAFGATLAEEAVVLRNDGTGSRTVTVQVSDDDPKLHLWQHDPQDPAGRWVSLFANPFTVAIPAGTSQRLRLGPVRGELVAGQLFEANLQVTDTQGMRILVPVSARGVSHAGLWVGHVIVNRVNRGGTTPLEPVGSPFTFRVILHVDQADTVKLLRDVVQLWQDGGWIPNPDKAGEVVPDPADPGSFVLVTDRTRLGDYRGAALRDGQEVGRRMSSAAFGIDEPLPMRAGGEFGLSHAVRFTIEEAPGAPSNPFLHTFHKDHGRPDQSYAITRDLTFSFVADEASGALVTGLSFLSWGSSEIGGNYSETIQIKRASDGSPNDPYRVDTAGTFRLRRVSDVDGLVE